MALCLDSHVVPKQKDSEPNKLTLFENYRPNFIMDIDCLYKASFSLAASHSNSKTPKSLVSNEKLLKVGPIKLVARP